MLIESEVMREDVLVIAGKNRVAVESLRLVISKKIVPEEKVIALPVVSDTGEEGWQPSLRRAADELQVECIDFVDLESISGVLISLEFDRIIRVNKYPKLKCFNIHFSKLPAYKGCWTSVLPILHGKKQSGVTLHLMDEGIDTGPIIAQRSIELDENARAQSLYEDLMSDAIILFHRNVRQLIDHSYSSRPQALDGATYFSRNSLDIRKTEIDFRHTFSQIDRRVRAFYFPVFQTATFQGKGIVGVRPLEQSVKRKPGYVFSSNHRSSLVQCIDCVLELIHVEQSDG